MRSLRIVLIVISVVLFVLSALGVETGPLKFLPLGLAFLAVAMLV